MQENSTKMAWVYYAVQGGRKYMMQNMEHLFKMLGRTYYRFGL